MHSPLRRDRCDAGFSMAQVLVTMVIVGILTVGVGLTVFSYINRARDTVLSANVTTAARAVETTLALNPGLRDSAAHGAPGTAPPDLMEALANAAPFIWTTPTASETWTFGTADDVDTIRIQMFTQAGAVAAAAANDAPDVDWLVSNGDAIRLQARNDDGSWACALVVMRPEGSAAANQRGIWYGSGTEIQANGLHHCSPARRNPGGDPVTGAPITGSPGTSNPGALSSVPANAQTWTIGPDSNGTTTATDNIAGHTLERSVPTLE